MKAQNFQMIRNLLILIYISKVSVSIINTELGLVKDIRMDLVVAIQFLVVEQVGILELVGSLLVIHIAMLNKVEVGIVDCGLHETLLHALLLLLQRALGEVRSDDRHDCYS